MSTIRKTPFIETVVNSLSSSEVLALQGIINSSSPANKSYSIANMPDSLGIYGVNFSAENNKIYTGILIYTENYAVLIAYHRFQDLLLFKIENGNLEKVNEYLDINELRRVVFKGELEGASITGDLSVSGEIYGNDYTITISSNDFEFTADQITNIGNYENSKIKYTVGDTEELLSRVRVDDVNNQIVFSNDAMQIVITYDNELGTATWEAKGYKYAETDGYYQDMTVGDAEQLISTVSINDQVPYNFRTSGGTASIGNRAYENKLVGGTLVFNQLLRPMESTYWGRTSTNTLSFDNNVATFTPTAQYGGIIILTNTYRPSIIEGHKYLVTITIKKTNATETIVGQIALPVTTTYIGFDNTSDWQTKSKIIEGSGTALGQCSIVSTLTSDWGSTQVKNFMLFDLTQMFGSTIADYLYGLSDNGGVDKFKSLFPNDYYDYDAGTMLSTVASNKTTTGVNQWDEEWEVGALNLSTGEETAATTRIRSKNYIRVLPDTQYYYKSPYGDYVLFYDINQNYLGSYANPTNTTFTTPTNCYYIKFYTSSSYGNVYKNDICINISWNGSKNGTYYKYEKNEYELPNTVLRGVYKLDASNNLYCDGDYVEPDGTKHIRYVVKRFTGEETGWVQRTTEGQTHTFTLYFNKLPVDERPKDNVWTNETTFTGGWEKLTTDNLYTTEGIYVYYTNTLYVTIPSANSLADFQSYLASHPLIIVYAKTPTIEQVAPYTQIQVVNDWGTEEITCYGYDEATATETTLSIPMGHNTDYPANLRDKVQNLPDNADSDGYYVVKQEGAQQSLYGLSSWLSANGYVKQEDLSSSITVNDSLTVSIKNAYKIGNMAFLTIRAKNETENAITTTASEPLISLPSGFVPTTLPLKLQDNSSNDLIIWTTRKVYYNTHEIAANETISITLCYSVA